MTISLKWYNITYLLVKALTTLGKEKGREFPPAPFRRPRYAALRGDLHRTMIVAMIAVGVMQMPVDQIVDMVAVRHRLVATARAMLMVLVVSATGMVGRAGSWIVGAHLDRVLVDVIAVRVMEMTVVQIVEVIAVLDGGMAAGRPVLVGMVSVDLVVVRGHDIHPFVEEPQCLSVACAMALRTRVRT